MYRDLLPDMTQFGCTQRLAAGNCIALTQTVILPKGIMVKHLLENAMVSVVTSCES